MKKKKLDFENLRDVVWISAPALSGDKTRAAYVRGVSDYDTGKILTAVKEKNLETGEERTVNLPDMEAKEPLYAPDGNKLAFLASDGRPWQLWIWENGEARQLTHYRYGVSAPSWAPDGKSLAYEVKYFPGNQEEDLLPEMSLSEYETYIRQKAEEPKVIENLIYKLDSDYGLRDGSRTAIGISELATGEETLVTPLDIPYQVPSFVQKGEKLACYGYPYTHCKELNSEIYLIDPVDKTVTMVSRTVPSYYSFPIQEDENGDLLYCGVHMTGASMLPEIYRVSPKGGESVLLFDTWPACHGLDPIYTGDAHLGQKDCPFTRDSEGNFFFVSYHMGRSNVFCWDGKEVYPVTEEDCVLSFAGPSHNTLVILKSEWNQPAYLALMELEKQEDGRWKAKEIQQFARENDWLLDYALTEPKKLSVKSKDGTTDLYGWAVIPAGTEEQIPAVLDVHGGPEACYVNGFFYEVQMMAARGMAVLFCDPRGSAGYGPDFMDGKFAYGPEAVEDYQAFLQGAFETCPQIDKKRVGVTGGSYGGHMTNKLISVTDDFAAAVTQRTWVNPSSSYGTGDMGFYSAGPMQGSFKDYMRNRVRQSIMKHIRNVHIPVLVLHGEQDYRCALEQGEQVYHVLRSLKPELPVKIVIFPEENHGVTREGKLHNQIRHMQEMTEWFEKYLGGAKDESGNQ